MQHGAVGALVRRDLLRAGSLALFGGLAGARSFAGAGSGVPFPNAARLPADRATPSRAKNCILIYLLGGPSHLDMWDPKPLAPREIRGPFQPIDTSVPGTHISEHLPLLAEQTNRLALVRSFSHPNNDHPFMIYLTLTGRVSPVPLGANTVLRPSRADFPHMGSVVSRFKHDDTRVPGYVAIPDVRVRMGSEPVSGGGRSGFLGPRYEPLSLNDDVRKPLPLLNPPHDVSSERFDGRKQLLAILDGRTPRALKTREYETTRQTALRLSSATGDGGLFDLNAEPVSVRDSYGRHRFGQSLLQARRLVERGVSFVGVHFNYMSKCDGWDTHKNNFRCLQNELLPMFDQGLASLLNDLSDRGLLEETLVVTMGEFGRTPRINTNAGRDHWGRCGSVVFAGGGVAGGTVVGTSDKTGADPKESPVGPADVVASIFHALDLDPASRMFDHLKRPQPLSTGTVISQLFHS